jgi:hypothetical protein
MLVASRIYSGLPFFVFWIVASNFRLLVPLPERQLYLTIRMAEAQMEGNKMAVSLVDSIPADDADDAEDEDDF